MTRQLIPGRATWLRSAESGWKRISNRHCEVTDGVYAGCRSMLTVSVLTVSVMQMRALRP